MKTYVSHLLIISLLSVSACGGRTPTPVMSAQYGDKQKSCDVLEHEIANVESEMQRILPKTDKTNKNVLLCVTGWFFIVPWFFMDFKNAEQTEYEALRQRYSNLTSLAVSKECDVSKVNYPSVEEIKRQVESQSKQQTPSQSNRK
ncbi:hypothetical protein IQ273_07690 [Nodosilinea sp. LEGE 07298]|uniref:hypothetical protein n=1 Tax=Nodosilinea sp. LEGE 07298 TaxID=2777970 RepID=UPI001881AB80|nr:hypothetical protein [Nodosilinea sp. LEGE 07298]MBE9109295.1 hypothetical protein [Nodosilinea sp. LEGE 07298]